MRSNVGRDKNWYVGPNGELVPVPVEFYNKSHIESGPNGGRFAEGPDGPGRKRDKGHEDLGVPGTEVARNKKAERAKRAAVAKAGGTSSKSSRVQAEAAKRVRGKAISMLSDKEFDAQIEGAVKEADAKKDSIWTKIRKLVTTKAMEAKWDARQKEIDGHKANIKESLAKIKKARAVHGEIEGIKRDNAEIEKLANEQKAINKKQAAFEAEVDKLAAEQERTIKDEAVYASGIFGRLAQFYNTSHGEGGQFDEGPDGPGRVRDPGTEDLGKPGYVSEPASLGGEKSKPGERSDARQAARGKNADLTTGAGGVPKGLSVADIKKAPPSAKTVRDINKGLGASKSDSGQYPDWTKYPGAPSDTTGDNWANFLASDGGKQFLADVEKFEWPEGKPKPKTPGEKPKE